MHKKIIIIFLNRFSLGFSNKTMQGWTVFRVCRGRSSKGRRMSSMSSIGSPLTTVRTLPMLFSSLVTIGRRKRRERGVRSPFAAFFRDRRAMGVA